MSQKVNTDMIIFKNSVNNINMVEKFKHQVVSTCDKNRVLSFQSSVYFYTHVNSDGMGQHTCK